MVLTPAGRTEAPVVTLVGRVLSADNPEARDLRQNSPFAGMLSEPERRKILATVK